MADNTKGEIVSDKDALRHGDKPPGLWLKKIKRAEKDQHEWHEAAERAIAIYEGRETEDGAVPAFNILHSNIEITVPSLYNSTPVPDIRRRFGDADPAAKQVVDALERALSFSVDQYDFDGTMIEVVRDAELAGRGVPRVRYKPRVETQTGPDGAEYDAVGYQEVTCEHVTWSKWLHGPARHWDAVPWVAFCHDLTDDDLRQLGLDDGRIKDLSFEAGEGEGRGEDDEKSASGVYKTVKAWEIWDKATRRVYWVAPQDKDEFLSVADDPLQLEQFFPIPKPAQPLRRRNDLTPIVPYEIYKTQVSELDAVTRRIRALVGQLRVRGLYDKRLGADLDRLRFCEDGQYEPAEDATMFAQGAGGLEKAIAHWPLAEIIAALQQLYIQRDQIKQTIYEITGLSDVLRGATNPNETLGAQQMKAQQGSTRLSQRQRMAADVCRQLFRMKVEIIANHFTRENIVAMTGVDLSPEAEQLMRSDMMRAFRVDVETDSTVRADLARSQEQMSLFLQGTAQYASAMGPIMQMQPNSKAAIVQIYAAFARHFKLGKSAEDALDQMIDGASQPEPEKPDPEQMKLQAEQQRLQMQAAAEAEKRAAEMQIAERKAAVEMELKQADMELKRLDLQVRQELAAIEIEKARAELALKRDAMEMDRQAKIFDIETKREMTGIEATARMAKMASDSQQGAAP
jgi:hypothetical protein